MIYLCKLCSEAQYACHLVSAAWLDPPVAFLTSLTVGLVVEEYVFLLALRFWLSDHLSFTEVPKP